MMDTTHNNITTETYTEYDEIKYSVAHTESVALSNKTDRYVIKTKSVPTSRIVGDIKLRISPREIPDLKTINSTK